MRLALVVLAACNAYADPVRVDGWVIDQSGPVANAQVRVVALTPAPCPCKPAADDDPGYGNEVPACRCAAALDGWRKRLAACAFPKPTHVVKSDAKGRVVLDARVRGGAIEASTPTSVQWLQVPQQADRVAIELPKALRPKLVLDQNVAVRAALLYEDGHCVPFHRDAGNTWISAGPVPRSEEWPTLLVEANGFAPIVQAWYEPDDEPLELRLMPAQPIRGRCSGDAVRVDNGFQQLTAKVDKQRFSVAGLAALDATVSCTKGGKLVEELHYTPGDVGFEEIGVAGGLRGGDCHDVVVVDERGRPMADAELTHYYTVGPSSASGSGAVVDKHGKACVDDMVEGGELVAHPPLERGGWCAGEGRVKVTKQLMKKGPIRVKVIERPLARVGWRGRVVSSEKIPVVGAHVSVRELEPSRHLSCTSRGDTSVRSGVDGRFELPPLPIGKVELEIQHGWYMSRLLSIKLPAADGEIVLDRGGTWTGRVLDPEGKSIDACSIFVTLADGRLITGTCTPSGFSFTALPPGDTKVSVRVENHALGTFRTLERTIKLGKAKHTDEIRWPKGESIAGRVVNKHGAPVAGARLTALPHGTAPLNNRFHGDEVMLEADDNGEFVFRHLAPGTWTIRGDHRDGKLTETDVKTGASGVQIVVTGLRVDLD